MLTVVLFWALAFIKFPPVIAAIAPGQLVRLYGVPAEDRALVTLLQHRAVLLGIVGAGCAVAAHVDAFRWPALWAAAISMVSFLIICFVQRQFTGPLLKIAVMDAIGIPILIALFLILPA
ncbi:MAG: hypothetical protein AAF996_16280 [Pseudomonadota bacterium]